MNFIYTLRSNLLLHTSRPEHPLHLEYTSSADWTCFDPFTALETDHMTTRRQRTVHFPVVAYLAQVVFFYIASTVLLHRVERSLSYSQGFQRQRVGFLRNVVFALVLCKRPEPRRV